MSGKRSDDWEDEVSDDEEDFVPGAYDDEEDDDSDVAYNDEVDPEDFPVILDGEMFVDKVKGLCYEKDGLFCLVCKTSFPDGSFSFGAPMTDRPLLFAGWIKDPGNWLEFEVLFSKEPMSTDQLEIELLKAQEERQTSSESESTTKTDVDMIDKKSTITNHNLKAPPSYSLKKSSEKFKNPSRDCNTKCGVSDSKPLNFNSKSDTQENTIFVVSGTQIQNEGNENCKFTFRGAYRSPPPPMTDRLNLICSIQSIDKGAVASGAAVSAATSSAASTRKKRKRSTGNEDDSIEGDSIVAYQELIGLHDDTRLSTEELRRKYYGTGETMGEINGEVNSSENKRFKGTHDGSSGKKVEDDDDDDAYGF
mmetsp:Transcript_4803/g.13868  ORF Transcript_4803/g.13868 Transcript_4803/m.13868 type:complete len:364 (+) Transcript_4803:109-1200(+)